MTRPPPPHPTGREVERCPQRKPTLHRRVNVGMRGPVCSLGSTKSARLRVVAVIQNPVQIKKILNHLVRVGRALCPSPLRRSRRGAGRRDPDSGHPGDADALPGLRRALLPDHLHRLVGSVRRASTVARWRFDEGHGAVASDNGGPLREAGGAHLGPRQARHRAALRRPRRLRVRAGMPGAAGGPRVHRGGVDLHAGAGAHSDHRLQAAPLLVRAPRGAGCACAAAGWTASRCWRTSPPAPWKRAAGTTSRPAAPSTAAATGKSPPVRRTRVASARFADQRRVHQAVVLREAQHATEQPPNRGLGQLTGAPDAEGVAGAISRPRGSASARAAANRPGGLRWSITPVTPRSGAWQAGGGIATVPRTPGMQNPRRPARRLHPLVPWGLSWRQDRHV